MMIPLVLECVQKYRKSIWKKKKKNILKVNKDNVANVKLCCLKLLTFTNNKKENFLKIFIEYCNIYTIGIFKIVLFSNLFRNDGNCIHFMINKKKLKSHR